MFGFGKKKKVEDAKTKDCTSKETKSCTNSAKNCSGKTTSAVKNCSRPSSKQK